ncbi:MAG: hypothetical protein IJ008_03290 [Clostridia bacterium]|nr:hypothetical protein [Clostridia bacterium]
MLMKIKTTKTQLYKSSEVSPTDKNQLAIFISNQQKTIQECVLDILKNEQNGDTEK